MRIIILVDDDHFFTPDFLGAVIEQLSDEIVAIGIAKPKAGLKNIWKNFKRDLMHNLTIFGLIGYIRLYFRQYLRKKRSDPKKGKFHSVAQVTKRYNVPLLTLYGINEPKSLEILRNLEPDIILSTQKFLFKKELLRLPKMGCINKHAALLPKYRGVWPIFWAMLDDEKEVGVSLHWMVEKYDAGGVIMQEVIPVEQTDTVFDLYEKDFIALSRMFPECISLLKQKPRYQRSIVYVGKKYYSFPKAQDVKKFKKSGKKLL